MADGLSLPEFITHPITSATAVIMSVSAVFHVPFIDALVSVLWTNAGSLFTALSVTSTFLAPRLQWLPEEPLLVAALVAGALFVLTKLDQLQDALSEKLKRK